MFNTLQEIFFRSICALLEFLNMKCLLYSFPCGSPPAQFIPFKQQTHFGLMYFKDFTHGVVMVDWTQHYSISFVSHLLHPCTPVSLFLLVLSGYISHLILFLCHSFCKTMKLCSTVIILFLYLWPLPVCDLTMFYDWELLVSTCMFNLIKSDVVYQ